MAADGTGDADEENGNGKIEVERLEKEELNLKDIDEDRVINREITREMKRSYIDYAMSVIVTRALPSIEDGLKPVHRRILYAMKLMGLEKGSTKKSARIVGDVMGKFHPHGDMAIYDSMVRMAQDFSLRYPLVKGQGNFGSIDGDSAGASRYTEAKLAKLSTELLTDIDKETIKFVPNFDNSVNEPLVLPGKVPNLLINGATGIAVGMTTNIPPHNLNEVCDGIISVINKPKIGLDELMEIIKGPDLPTGGQIVGENLEELYKTGRAGFVVRGKVKTEEKKGKESIIITEIPYQVNKSSLVMQIAELVRDKKLTEVSDIRDESAKGNIRVVIELKKGANSQFTINRLFKSTKLQSRFDAVLVALEGGVPKTFGLRGMIDSYIKFRQKVIRKRTEFDLDKAEKRLHIVLGLLLAQKSIDKIIETIKKSNGSAEAKENLIKKFKLSEKQAEAILEITLRQLTALEREKLQKEECDLKELIVKLKKILGDEKEILKLIRRDLEELKKTYGDPRRSRIIRSVKDIDEKDLVQKKDVIITITEKGYIKRMPFKAYNEQKRGGRGVIGAELSTEDFVKELITCSTHDHLLLFTERGRLFWLKAYKVPETQRYGKGQAIINLLNIKDDRVTSVIAVKEFEDYLFMATEKGMVKKIKLDLFSKPRNSGVRIINLPADNSDMVVGVKKVKDKQEVMLMTMKGQAIRFNSDEVRNMGRASYGVTGIKMDSKDKVVSMEIVEDKMLSILTITERGYGKRSKIDDYRLTGRAGKGVINLKVGEKTGEVVSTIEAADKDKFVVSTKKGIVIRTSVKDIRVMGRATSGVRIIKLGSGDRVVDIARLDEGKEKEISEKGNEENGQKSLK
ncbi:DNA gyrase subunit A [Candidatus Pacearchaeota archaeon]|nr:DNA gyrase subunit A [Candidatus Pacearchaeota archaeon]